MVSTIAALSALIVLILVLVLVFDRDYEDGLFGRFGLALLGLSAFARFSEYALSEAAVYFSTAELFAWVGAALFFMRHWYRFRMWHRAGKYDWRDATCHSTGGKVPQK